MAKPYLQEFRDDSASNRAHTIHHEKSRLMAFQERCLPGGDRGPVRRPRRIRQAHGEQRGLGLDPGQNDP